MSTTERFGSQDRPEPTPEQAAKLENITSQRQRETLLEAIANGESIPDYAWTPLPDVLLDGEKLLEDMQGRMAQEAAKRGMSLDELRRSLEEDPGEPSDVESPGTGDPENETDLIDFKALAEEPGRWPELSRTDLSIYLFRQCMLFGMSPGQDLKDQVRALYRVAVDRLSAKDRLSLVEAAASFVETGEAPSEAFLPFVMFEDNVSVVSTAALNAASFMSRVHDDPLTGPKTVLRMADDLGDVAKAGIFAGLLMLGDRRVTELLGPCWRRLGAEERQRLAMAQSGFAYAASIDFYLAWLEECEGDEFGAVAGTLAHLGLYAAPRFVLDVERVLPVTEAAPDEEIRVLARWPIAEYGKRIERRLRKLAATESDPPVMPMVLEAWGLSAG